MASNQMNQIDQFKRKAANSSNRFISMVLPLSMLIASGWLEISFGKKKPASTDALLQEKFIFVIVYTL